MTTRVQCRKGDLCSFTVNIASGLPARYTEARFQVRMTFDEAKDALLSIDETNGITIAHAAENAVQSLSIGAVQTETLPVVLRPIDAVAQLRFYDPTNDNDRISFVIPFVLLPDAIDD